MEFLADSDCCRKCLKKGIRVPYAPRRARERWCKACWHENYLRLKGTRTVDKQQKLRAEEWKARAMMTKEERRKTRLVHIPKTTFTPGRRQGKIRLSGVYLSMYARYRNRIFKQLFSDPDPPPPPSPPSSPRPVGKSRHNVLPIA